MPMTVTCSKSERHRQANRLIQYIITVVSVIIGEEQGALRGNIRVRALSMLKVVLISQTMSGNQV